MWGTPFFYQGKLHLRRQKANIASCSLLLNPVVIAEVITFFAASP